MNHVLPRVDPPASVLGFARAYRCPDCTAVVDPELLLDDLGVWHMQVLHDETCPTYQAMQP